MDKELKRDFELPEEDEVFLNKQKFIWETLIDNGVNWLIIRDFPIRSGYTVSKADAAIKIPSDFPDSKLDMVNFYPHVLRTDNVFLPNVGDGPSIEKNVYQQWSRHRDWRIGIDTLENHVEEINHWLDNEFKKRPMQ